MEQEESPITGSHCIKLVLYYGNTFRKILELWLHFRASLSHVCMAITVVTDMQGSSFKVCNQFELSSFFLLTSAHSKSLRFHFSDMLRIHVSLYSLQIKCQENHILHKGYAVGFCY